MQGSEININKILQQEPVPRGKQGGNYLLASSILKAAEYKWQTQLLYLLTLFPMGN